MDRIILIRDGSEVVSIPVQGPAVEIGSSTDNALCLPVPGVRPYHAVLRHRRGRWFAVARGGTIGMSDGRTVSSAALEPESRILAGPYELRLARDRGRAEARAAPPHDSTRPAMGPIGGLDAGIVLRLASHGALRHHAVERGTLTIGRGPSCDLILEDPTVSERHAGLTVDAGGAVVEDLASLNGTFLDERRIHVAEIGNGGLLRLGRTEIECIPRRDSGGRPARGILRTAGLAEAFERARRAAPLREPVLLLGETGSGKEILARALHSDGSRRSGSFVAVNCAALPREIAESILFGHQRGAFTGAAESHRGAFQRADRGTLFLDEIGEAPPEIQAKLLRAVEGREVLPVGGERPVPVDVRVVAATNRDLVAESRVGRFRSDLYHRLSAIVIHIPPLRERPEDVAPLAEAFLESLASDLGERQFLPAALRKLERHYWSGNVRELRNVVLRSAFESPGPEIGPEHVALDDPSVACRPSREVGPDDIAAALRAHGGNVSAVAKALGLPRSTIRDRLAALRREATPA